MNILFIILIVVLAIVTIVLVAALFVKRQYVVKRDIVIKKPLAEVFDFVKHLKNQDRFSKWVMMDPDMKKEFRGVDGTVGFIYAWDGDKQAGQGEQEIMGIDQGRRVDIEIRFVRPFRSTARVPIETERITEHQTKVVWAMEGTSKYPLNLLTAMMSGALGKDMEVSLRNLKDVLEQPQDTKQ